MAARVSTPVPPAFDKAVWEGTPSADEPNFYHGTLFDYSFLAQLIGFSEQNCTVRLFRTETAALSVSNPKDSTNTPIIFRLDGKTFMYKFMIWSDRVVIEVHGKSTRGRTPRSVMFPARKEHLRMVLRTIRSDLVK